MVVLNVIAAIATVITLVAALLTVGYARQTVKFAKQTIDDGRDAHGDLMSAQKLARDQFADAHRDQMAEQSSGRKQFADEQAQGREQFEAAHREEMAQRRDALASEVALQRLAHAGRIADVLITMARTAYSETVDPPPFTADGRRTTLIPSIQAHLRATLAIFYALGGPALATSDELAQYTYSQTSQPTDLLKLAQNSLGELVRLADHDEQLRLAESP